jgi:carboxypeptidase Taq
MAGDSFTTLKSRLAEISDLRKVASLLFWDQQVMMPRAAAPIRAEQLATIDRTAHESFVSDETGRLLDAVRSYEESLDPDSDDASLIRVTRKDYEKARRVPSDLRAEMTRAASHGFQTWQEAKAASDFARFLPALQRNVELKLRYIACFDPVDEPYDILLDDYERGMTTAEVREIFDELKTELVPLVRDIAERDDPSLADVLDGDFGVDAQRTLSHEVVERFGFREQTWRLDPTSHPFASGGGVDDIRITTFYHPTNLDSLFATMHEYGHGLYEHQIDPALGRSPLGSGVSLGLHESQSRMWENLVGRSLPFWRGFYGRLQELFPAQLGAVDVERWYAAVNRVHPSLIRIHADEVTYNMHVILRFELEQDIVNGRIDLRELPEIWNRKMADYLGVEPGNDAEGVLQDVHWSGGAIGYFSTYSLGNVMSLQIWERVLDDLPDVYDAIERGEYGELREWLRVRLHRHGRKHLPKEMLERIVGGPIDAGPYLRYLKEKHGAPAAA